MKKNLQILILSIFILFISINLVSASENISDINNGLNSSNDAISENLNNRNTNINDVDNSVNSESSYNDSIDDNSYNNYAKNQKMLRNRNINSGVLNSYDDGVYVGKNTTVNGTGTKDDPFNNLKLALDKVSSNKTVYVYGGIYTGEKNTGLIITGDTSIIKYGGGDVVFKGSNSIIFNVTGSNCVFKGLIFVNGYSDILSDYNNFTNCSFINCSSSSDGGAISIQNRFGPRNNNFNDCSFVNCSSSNNGGAVSIKTIDTMSTSFGNKFNNCSFVNCSSSNNGGAIYFGNKTEDNALNNCTFINNKAANKGGAVYSDTYEVSVNNPTFTDNTAINGNDIYCTYTLVLMENQTVKADANKPFNLTAKLIKENNLTEDVLRVTFLLNNTDVGSSIVDSKKFTANYKYKNYFDDVLIVSGKFYNFNIVNIKTGVVIFENSTYRNRGPYYVSIDGDDYKNDGSENSPFRTLAHAVSFTNIPFNNKTIIVKKGTYNEENQIRVESAVNIIGEDNPTITSNLSTYLFMAYEDMRINGISFVNHYSEGDAGVIFSTKSVYLNNSNFINCTSEGYGGAIYAYKDIYAENTSFINNTAYVGGSINGLNINVNNCTFINSSTKLSGYDNEESQGGAIEGGDIKVNNCTFIDNSAEYIGGAINSKFTYSIVNVTNSIFIGNHVKYGSGGAITSETEDNYVNNCTFINNSGDCGGAIGLPKGTITNSTFKNNSARTGGAISLNKGTVENCSFMNNSAKEGYVVEILSDGKIVNSIISSDQYSLFNYPFINVEHTTKTDDGYYCLCIEQQTIYAEKGSVSPLRGIYNCVDGSNVTEYLKILCYIYGNTTDDYDNNLLELNRLIWIFTKGNYLNSDNTTIQEVLKLYNDGFRVNDTNTIKTLDGKNLSMVFKKLLTAGNQENLIMFKFEPLKENLTVKKETLDTNIPVGTLVRFNVTVLNNGDITLENVFVNDSDFDSGLTYYGYENTSSHWIYKDGKFVLESHLSPDETANLIIIFNTTKTGILINNLSTGYDNLTLANASNNTVVIDKPANYNMTVIKITNNKTVYVGNITSFTIVVKNVGDGNLTGVNVLEYDYTGLSYTGFTGDNWINKGDMFYYNGVLAPGESSNFTVYFNTTKTGNFTNTVVAGSNEINNISALNITEVIKNTNNTNNTNNTSKKHNNTNITPIKEDNKKFDIGISNYKTGNPLYILYLALGLTALMPLKRKK